MTVWCEICGQLSPKAICDACLADAENNPVVQERIMRCCIAQDDRDDEAVTQQIAADRAR